VNQPNTATGMAMSGEHVRCAVGSHEQAQREPNNCCQLT
jgi:hypothetical protein